MRGWGTFPRKHNFERGQLGQVNQVRKINKMSLEELLVKKTVELEILQRSFDEYVESSKELENELDKSLSAVERVLKDKEQKLFSAELKVKELVEECTYLKKVNGNLQEQSLSAKAKLASLEDSKRNLEVKTEDLSNQ
eukprot:scaffold4648_cov158-Ochromonas_danica.AAC.9